jgi:hypothetical protein
MANENDGGHVWVQVEESGWENQIDVLVTKRYIINTDDEGFSRWDHKRGLHVNHPSSEEQVENLLLLLSDLHEESNYSDFISKQVQAHKLAHLEREVEELKKKNKRLNDRIIEYENKRPEWY